MSTVYFQEPIVDYISISIPVPKLLDQYTPHIKEGYPYEPEKRIKKLVNLITSLEDPILYGGKGVFNRQLHFAQSGFSYFDGDKSNVSLLQISGEGCQYLRKEGYLNAVIHDWHDRFTRFDVAVDIETDTHPYDFYCARSNLRFKSDSHDRSPRGDTWYVGGKKSNRHARVYRYNPPHPRSPYLRIEYELHDEDAKKAGLSVDELGVSSVAWALGRTFGWTHPDYIPPSDADAFTGASRPASFGKTDWWLVKAVLPAIRKMAQSGKLQFLIDFESQVRAIIDEYSSTRKDIDNDMALPNWLTDDAQISEDHTDAWS